VKDMAIFLDIKENSKRRGTLDKMMEGYGDKSGLAEEEVMIAAIPKNKAEELVEIIRCV
jgi:hypothetical protein